MPFTPFHFGPGIVIKSILPAYFSFTVFAFTQVLIDFESLYYLVQDAYPVHRFFHTYAGSTVAVLLVLIIGRPVCEWFLRAWNSRLDDVQSRWLSCGTNISFAALLISALSGAYSHVLLDSIMHADSRPLAPLSEKNNLLGVLSISDLHLLCVLSGIAGALILLVTVVIKKHQVR